MNEAQKIVMVERLKVTMLPVLGDSEACGFLAADLLLGALDQHIKGVDDAKRTAKLLRDYAHHIVSVRS